MLVEHAHEFRAHRLLDLLGHQPDGIVERHARPNAAHDGFDGIGQFVEIGVLIFLAPPAQIHVGQHIGAPDGQHGGVEQRHLHDDQNGQKADAQDYAIAHPDLGLGLDARLEYAVLQ